MSELTIKTFRQQFRQLYNAKEYAQALTLTEKEHANFPADAHEISYWRICLYALVGKPTEALSIFQAVLDRGDWFPLRWVRKAPDLASLKPLPEFQAMVAVCRQRLAELQANAHPALLVRQPAEHAINLPLLIAMHGNRNNANNTVEHWNAITTQGWLLAIPQSSQVVGPDAFVWDERETGISEVREHLVTLNNEHKLDPQRVVLGGFSMGGGQAILMALQQSVKTCGFVTLGPYMREDELEALPALLETHKPAGIRGTILVGEEDSECLAVSRKVVEIMRTYDLPCELEIRPGLGHSYPTDFAEWATKGLAFIEQA